MAKALIYSDPDYSGIHVRIDGDLAVGQPFSNGVAISTFIRLAGMQWFRIHFKATGGGSLTLQYLQAGQQTAVLASGNPAAVAIVANTENKLDVNPHFGEFGGILTYTPTADGVISVSEYSGVSPARR